MTATLIKDWREKVVYGDDGPRPQPLISTPKLKSVLAGLKPGQKISPHPGPGAVYHFLQGSGKMFVDDEVFDVGAGSTVVVPDGALRGMEAESQMAFLGTHSGEG